MKKLLLLFSLFALYFTAFSQFSYTAANAVNVAGTYTDLGTSGTVITTAGFDDNNSTAQNIGFTFFFNGANFTQFILNTNGFIKLGSAAPTGAAIYSALSSTETNLIYPLNLDLIGGTNPEYRVFTSGSAPTRICTIQFKNVADYFPPASTASQFQEMNFQVKLYETSNNIEFVYGSFVAGATPAAAYLTEAGIKGSTAANSVNVTKGSNTAWASASFVNNSYDANAVNAHNIRNNVLPVPGRTYRFAAVALPANDAQVSNIYSLAKIPVGYGSPHVVSAVITNSGAGALANVGVTLSVTGANIFSDAKTIANLAAGASATVSFAAYSPANLGTNTLNVSVAADDNNSNNTLTTTQLVNSGTFSYADNAGNNSSVGYGTGAGLILTRYTLSGSGYITNVNVFIPNATTITGNSVYAVVLDNAGTIIGQSANAVIAAADLGTYKNFLITTSPLINSAGFFVGLAQTANATAYFPVGTQTEAPARAGAFYTAPLAAGVAPAQNTTLGKFMIEAVVAAFPLPVKLTDFSGRIAEDISYLTWSTASELNSDHFEVEKTLVGTTNWSVIGKMAAAGYSNTPRKYDFTDAGITAGKWLYRLKVVDKDASFAYSPVVMLELTGNKNFTLRQNYPNPVKDITLFRYELGRDAAVVFELFGMDGRKIMNQQQGSLKKGVYTTPVDVKLLALPSGKYIYRMLIKDKVTGQLSSLTREMNVIK